MNHPLSSVSVKQLQRAVKIKAKIEVLQAQLREAMGFGQDLSSTRKTSMSVKGKKLGKPTGRRKMSAAAKAKMSSVAKARWAKAKAAGKTSL